MISFRFLYSPKSPPVVNLLIEKVESVIIMQFLIWQLSPLNSC